MAFEWSLIRRWFCWMRTELLGSKQLQTPRRRDSSLLIRSKTQRTTPMHTPIRIFLLTILRPSISSTSEKGAMRFQSFRKSLWATGRLYPKIALWRTSTHSAAFTESTVRPFWTPFSTLSSPQSRACGGNSGAVRIITMAMSVKKKSICQSKTNKLLELSYIS